MSDNSPGSKGAQDVNDPNAYSIDQYLFPPKLGWMKEYQSYVIFYINVVEGSASASNTANVLGPAPLRPGEVQGKAFGIKSKKYMRLKTAVALPIMEAPIAKYGADWDTASLGPVVGWAMTTGSANGGGGLNEGFSKAFSQGAGNLTLDAIKALGLSTINAATNAFGIEGDATTSDIFSTIRRTAINEHRTQLFRSMRFRDFEFTYRFEPQNEAEAKSLKRIINVFKYYMHPDASDGNLFLTYPAEFDIVFYFQNKENTGPNPEDQNLFKISACALTDFQINYGGEQFATFEEGMPTSITMGLHFTELEQLTSERIAQGF